MVLLDRIELETKVRGFHTNERKRFFWPSLTLPTVSPTPALPSLQNGSFSLPKKSNSLSSELWEPDPFANHDSEADLIEASPRAPTTGRLHLDFVYSFANKPLMVAPVTIQKEPLAVTARKAISYPSPRTPKLRRLVRINQARGCRTQAVLVMANGRSFARQSVCP